MKLDLIFFNVKSGEFPKKKKTQRFDSNEK